MLYISQAIPCILHCEMRVGEKIIRMLLIDGITKKGVSIAEQIRVAKTTETFINTVVLGSIISPAKWNIPCTKDNKFKIGDMSMSNKNIRKFMDKFDDLIDLLITDDLRKSEWKQSIEFYKTTIEIARKKEKFSSDDIECFQNAADDFFKLWIKLHDIDGITNYIHMIGAGHFKYYLQKHGNLYKFSQQGWESLNSLIKQFYYRRTQQGGYSGIKNKENSRILPIVKWMQRKLWWLHKKVEQREMKQIEMVLNE